MADKHPYVTGTGGLAKTISQFRKAFPATVNADTLRKLGFAPKNESYIITTLRFLDLIDEDGKKTNMAATVFSNHEDSDFAQAFASKVQESYSDLFELHGDQSWALDKRSLISFFRGSDQTSEITGTRQASTFQLLAKFAGHGDVPDTAAQSRPTTKPVTSREPRRTTAAKSKQTTAARRARTEDNGGTLAGSAKDSESSKVGLTVRIEINLPADGDQDTYDRIFRSIRENLLND